MIQEYRATENIDALTDFALLERLGNISPRTLERYYDGTTDRLLEEREKQENTAAGNNTKQTFGDALKRLVEYRRGVCVRHIASGGASTTITGWIFLSKQPHWGGFQDVQRQERTGVQEFKITLSGPDGKSMGD
jgi:hypothetical protein